MRALTAENPDLRLLIVDSLELITVDDKNSIAEGLKKLRLMTDDLSLVVIVGASANMKFKQNKRNVFERYADVLLTQRKNSKNYVAEIIAHEENGVRFDYDDTMRGIVKVSKGNRLLVSYPVEVQVRTREGGLLGTAILRYMPQKGVFVNAK